MFRSTFLGMFRPTFRYLGTRSVRKAVSQEKISIGLKKVNSVRDACQKMTIVEFNSWLSRLVELKEYDRAISLFKDVCNLDYTLNTASNCYCLSNWVVSTLLKGLFKENRIPEAIELFEEIARKNLCDIRVETYETMIDGLCKSGNGKMAIHFFKKMHPFDGQTFVTIKDGLYNELFDMIIDALYKEGNIYSALEFYSATRCANIVPNVATYNALLRSLRNIGHEKKFMIVVKDMVERKIYPDAKTYSIILDPLGVKGLENEKDVLRFMMERNSEGVLSVFMQENGDLDGDGDLDVISSSSSFNSLIERYCLEGQVDKARSVIHFMDCNNISLDTNCYSCLIDKYCLENQIDDAMHLFHEMARKALKPTVTIYNSILDGLFFAGKCLDALQIFDEMQVVGLEPCYLTYVCVLQGLCGNGQIDQAMSLLNELEHKGALLHSRYYEILIKGLCADGQVGRAKDLLLTMDQVNLPPEVQHYSSVFRGFLMRGKYSDASNLFKEMRGRGFSPFSELGILNSLLDMEDERNPTLAEMIDSLESATV